MVFFPQPAQSRGVCLRDCRCCGRRFCCLLQRCPQWLPEFPAAQDADQDAYEVQPAPRLDRSGTVSTSVFGVQAQGSRFVYVFDRSGSMADFRGRPLAAAKQELVRSLADLQDTNQFQIIFYNERPKIFRPRRRASTGVG